MLFAFMQMHILCDSSLLRIHPNPVLCAVDDDVFSISRRRHSPKYSNSRSLLFPENRANNTKAPSAQSCLFANKAIPSTSCVTRGHVVEQLRIDLRWFACDTILERVTIWYEGVKYILTFILSHECARLTSLNTFVIYTGWDLSTSLGWLLWIWWGHACYLYHHIMIKKTVFRM